MQVSTAVLFVPLSLVMLCACAGPIYRISGFDVRSDLAHLDYTDTANCRPSLLELMWDRSFGATTSNSYYLYTGEKVDNVLVNRVKLLEGAAYAIDRLPMPICENVPKATVTLLGVTHRHHVSPDINADYVSAQVTLLAKVECATHEGGDYDLYTGRSPKSKAGFWSSTDGIQAALTKSSSEAAVMALLEVLKQCGK